MVDHKINHKYPKSLSIPILNTTHDRVHIPTVTVIGTLHPVETESNEISNISCTTTEKLQDSMRNSSTKFLIIPPESSFQPEHHKSNKEFTILQNVQVLE